VVESGTSSLYSAIRDATDGPVLKAICHRIAGDEFRHYRLFYDTIDAYQAIEPLAWLRRLQVVVGRFIEVDDDELAFAFHCANSPDRPYNRRDSTLAFQRTAFSRYRQPHVARGVRMMVKATGLDPQGRAARLAIDAMWWIISRRGRGPVAG